jgi:ankyrin repeat protein
MTERDYSELHFAAQKGNLGAVVELLRAGHDPNQFDECGCTPLHYAAEGAHHDVMRALLAGGADVNACDVEKIGDTVISHVAGNCSLETAKLLVDAGADPTIRGWMQLHALHHSEKRKRGDGPQVHQLLLRAARRA